MNYSCLLFDFDGTLAYYKDDKQGLWQPFLKHGVSKEIITKIYEKTKNNNFSLEKFAQNINSEIQKKINEEEVVQELKHYLKENLVLYDDAKIVVQNKMNVPFVLLTFGDPGFQIDKINALDVKKDLVIFSLEFPKIDILGGLIKDLRKSDDRPLMFVDNSWKELDAVRDAGYTEKEIVTYWINRDNYTKKPKYKHIEIHSLNEIA
jgi:FMN phosphatase YigB (HAD superfamily)